MYNCATFRSNLKKGTSGVGDPVTGKDLTVEEAILAGLIDLPRYQ